MFNVKMFVLPLVVAVGVALSFTGTRDGTFTPGIESFNPYEIRAERLWRESPVQLINTFFLADTVIWGLGADDVVSKKLLMRLANRFPDEQLDDRNKYFELDPNSDDQTLETLRQFLDTQGYYTSDSCPHNTDLDCEIGLAWNRQITKTEGVELIFLRTGDREYTFIDSTLVGSPSK